MSSVKVLVGYGTYKNYSLQEIPNDFLSEIAKRYPLSLDAQKAADYRDLQLTVAIHEEVQRRKDGGSRLQRRPTARELAQKLVNKGFQSLSKDHHPDRGGDEETQKRLAVARRDLLEACERFEDIEMGDALTIPEPAAYGPEITDEDIPF